MNALENLSAALGPLLAGARECVLVDYPNHSNVGDSAIWLGEIALLKHMGVKVRALCEHTPSQAQVTSLIGDAVVLIHGGGNFGDIWPQHEAFRQLLCRSLPRSRIIQLPQSVHYGSPDAYDAARAVYSRHEGFHVIARDKASYQAALGLTSGRASLAPDSAMCLTARDFGVSQPVTHDIVLLARQDKESTISDKGALLGQVPGGVTVLHTDWLEENPTMWHRLYRRASLIDVNKERAIRPLLRTLAVSAADRLALHRVRRGARILSSGRAVITDRLHSVVMSWILGVPVFYFDNSYGKLDSVLGCWLAGTPGIQRCESSQEALAAAARHVRQASR